MATTVTKIIDPDNGSGTDYTSLAAWEAGQQGDLTGVRDEIAVAKCRCTGGTADTTGFQINGWTTSATQYIKIWTDTSETYRHNGTWQTGNKYRLDTSSVEDEWDAAAFGIRISEENVRIDGLQIYPRSVGISLEATIAYNVLFTNLVIKGYGAAESYKTGIVISEASGTATVKIVNCIIYDMGNPSSGSYSAAVYSAKDLETLSVYIYNCTAHNCRCGFKRSVTESVYIKNCLACDCYDGFATDWRWTTGAADYNASDLASDAPGANSRNSQTFTFVDESGDNFHLASTDAGALGYGTNLYNDAAYPFQTDIDGQDRGGSGATWDIGADEYVAAASSTRVPFRRMNVLLRLCLSVLTLFGRLLR